MCGRIRLTTSLVLLLGLIAAPHPASAKDQKRYSGNGWVCLIDSSGKALCEGVAADETVWGQVRSVDERARQWDYIVVKFTDGRKIKLWRAD